jgi:hypothetical protein
MDRSEGHVFEHLKHRGFSDIVYEPDGNVPPDFLIDERIAVEVRRLNQNEQTPSGYRGLEEVAIPFDATVGMVLESLGPPTAGASWYVLYSFKRPVPERKEIERGLRASLEAFRNQGTHQPARFRVTDALTVRLFRAGKLYPSFFVLGGSADHDSGGFVLAEMERNLHICVTEKTKKVSRVRSKYPEWWLALVDEIGYGLDEFDREQLRKLVQLDHSWDKIILVNPLDHRRAFEL